MTNRELVDLIRSVAAAVEQSDERGVTNIVQPLRDAGIVPNCHIRRGAEMTAGSETGLRLQLEWFAGQLLGMVDDKAWFGINSWLNCLDKFAPKT